MVATFTKSFQFNLHEFLATNDPMSGLRWSANVVASFQVYNGANQSVPDWCGVDDTFIAGVADGSITVVTPPANPLARFLASSLAGQGTIALPSLGGLTNVLVTNYSDFGVYVALGTATPVTPTSGSTLIAAKSSATLAVGSNSYIAGLVANDGYAQAPLTVEATS